MKYIVGLCFLIMVNILWLIGGQCNKTMRRYALPAVCAFKGLLEARKGHRRWDIPLVASGILVGLLSMGYGVDSWLKRICGGVEWITRLVMSLALSMSVCLLMLPEWSWLKFTIIVMIGSLAWQVRAGSLCKFGQYDILIEDICRASALALSVCLIYK